MRRSVLAVVLALVAWLAPALALAQQTHETVPSANATFVTDLQNFLKKEANDRASDMVQTFVVSGGTHGTGAGLTWTPTALVAYPGGTYITESGSITYPNASTCWVIANTATSGNSGNFNRVSGTHYLTDCTDATQPATPASSVYLMKVVTSGGSVTTVTDLRTLIPFASVYQAVANLPAASTPGRMAWVAGSVNLYYVDTGSAWVQFEPSTTYPALTNGQLPIGSTGNPPVAATLTQGNNAKITNAAGAITIAALPAVYNVADYGAKCDGSTDDTTSIQSALNAIPVNGGTVTFPNTGFCKVNGTLTVPKGMRIAGQDLQFHASQATIKQYCTTCSTFNVTTTDPVVFEDLTIDVSAVVASAGAAIDFTNGTNLNKGSRLWHVRCISAYQCAYMYNAYYWNIEGVFFDSPKSHAIIVHAPQTTGSGENRIIGSFFGCGGTCGDAINFQDSGGLEITGNKVLGYTNGVNLTIGTSTSSVTIAGNEFENQATGGAGILIQQAIAAQTLGSVAISGNEISSQLKGIWVSTGGTWLQNVSITGNTFSPTGVGSVSVRLDGGQGVTVSGNQMFGGTTGVYLNGVANATVSGNNFYNETTGVNIGAGTLLAIMGNAFDTVTNAVNNNAVILSYVGNNYVTNASGVVVAGANASMTELSLGYATTNANLTPRVNGSMIYCSDCTIANPCAAGGTGAIAKRLNGAYVCN